MTLYVDDPDVRVYLGSAEAVLDSLEPGSVDCLLTSPPFWALRSYLPSGHPEKGLEIGAEDSPEEWAARLVEVFAAARRVLAPHGTMWIEVGDSYASGEVGRHDNGRLVKDQGRWRQTMSDQESRAARPPALKPKDLVGQPFLLAFALRAAGWYWRGMYPWIRPNPLPESVADRFTTCHSHVIHVSKRPRYYHDRDAVRQPAAWERWGDQTVPKYEGSDTGSGWMKPRKKTDLQSERGRGFAGALPPIRSSLLEPTEQLDDRYLNPGNQRLELASGKNHLSFFDIPTEPNELWACLGCEQVGDKSDGAERHRQRTGHKVAQHYAAFPRRLAREILLAACPREVCDGCGRPRERIAAAEYVESPVHRGGSIVGSRATDAEHSHETKGRSSKKGIHGQPRLNRVETTTGWSDCGCDAGFRPGRVLDPFLGSGTSAVIARALGVHCVGAELYEPYARMTRFRLSQLSLLADGA